MAPSRPPKNFGLIPSLSRTVDYCADPVDDRVEEIDDGLGCVWVSGSGEICLGGSSKMATVVCQVRRGETETNHHNVFVPEQGTEANRLVSTSVSIVSNAVTLPVMASSSNLYQLGRWLPTSRSSTLHLAPRRKPLTCLG